MKLSEQAWVEEAPFLSMRRMSPFLQSLWCKVCQKGTSFNIKVCDVHLCWFVSGEYPFYTLSKCAMSLVVSHSHTREVSNKVIFTYIFKKHFIVCQKAGH